MTSSDRSAWGDFWARESGTSRASGCLPKGIAGIQAVQEQVWHHFVQGLRRRADVLDVATGDGAVPKMLLARRRDLKITGIDSASALPPPPQGATFKVGIMVEKLPFQAQRFDAVTSQFGYEYSDTASAAAEVARVLRPGATICFIAHHADGPILRHNKGRREALSWAINGGAHLSEARQLAYARASLPIPTPPLFTASVATARQLFPTQTVAQEFCEAVRQCLMLGLRTPPAQTMSALDQLEEMAQNEIARINSLERAVCDHAKIDQMIGQLETADVALETPVLLHERSEQPPFAWLLTGIKRSPR